MKTTRMSAKGAKIRKPGASDEGASPLASQDKKSSTESAKYLRRYYALSELKRRPLRPMSDAPSSLAPGFLIFAPLALLVQNEVKNRS